MPKISKSHIALVLFGLTLGLLITAVSYPILKKYADKLVIPKGAEFESVDDLRANLIKKEPVTKGKSADLRDLLIPNNSNLIMYELASNLDVTFQRANVKTNSYGMRNRELSLEKPKGTYRIALLGDSFAFGWGVEQEQGFAHILEEQLNKNSNKDINYEVLNFGVPGYSTFQEVEQFMQTGIKFNPDAVLVFFIENDFGLPFFIKNFATGEGLTTGNNFNKNKKDLSAEQKENRKQVLNSIDPSRALKKLDTFCNEKNIKLFLTINPNKKVKKIKSQLWYLRNENNIKVLNLRRRFLEIFYEMGIPEDDLRLSFDNHPSPIKHKILGLVIEEKIRPQL